jgi:hypothetical protein
MSQKTFDLVCRLLDARASTVDVAFALVSGAAFGFVIARHGLAAAFAAWAVTLGVWIFVVIGLRQIQAVSVQGLFESKLSPEESDQ